MIPTLDLDAIEARLAAATPGPWANAGYPLRGRDGPEVRFTGDQLLLTMEARPNDDNDATLIAHAPADLAALVAEVRRLRGDIDAARLSGVEAMREAARVECEAVAAAFDADDPGELDGDEDLAAHDEAAMVAETGADAARQCAAAIRTLDPRAVAGGGKS